MNSKRNQLVVPAARWAALDEGVGRIGGVYDAKTEMTTAAHSVTQGQVARLADNGRDGCTQVKDGHDPCAPNG